MRTGIRYLPAGTPVIVKRPSAPVLAVNVVPTRVTTASATGTPVVESLTVPEIEPDCRAACPADRFVTSRIWPVRSSVDATPVPCSKVSSAASTRTAASCTDTGRSSGTTRPEYAMRTPLCRARASSASLSGTPSRLSVTVRSRGDAASACCDRPGAVATTSIPANEISNRMMGLLRSGSPMKGSESHHPAGARPARVEHPGQRRQGFIDRAGRKRDREPLGGPRGAAGLDVDVVPAPQLSHDVPERGVVEHERAASPSQVVAQRDARRRAQPAARVDHAAIARPQTEHRVVPSAPPGPQHDAARRDDDLHVVLLRVRAHVEAGTEILSHALAGAHEEGTAGGVAHGEGSPAREPPGARAGAREARAAQPGAHAQQDATAVGGGQLQAPPGRRPEFGQRRRRRSPPAHARAAAQAGGRGGA